MTFTEIASRLGLMEVVHTPCQHVLNRIVQVGPDRVTVESERTAHQRVILFRYILNRTTMNGSVIDGLRQALGLA